MSLAPALRLLMLLTLLVVGSPLAADTDPSVLCAQAAKAASDRSGVPYEVLLVISVVETGRNQRPWPWTVNLGGDGHWLDSAAEAEALVSEALDRGLTNIDLGCFQLNYRWHASAFSSIADMLDPERNAQYAAEYIGQHYSRTGDWALAAAAYHSATPEYADRYRARYEATLAELGNSDPPEGPPNMEDRVNGFPLLLAGSRGRNGSLVPATPGGIRLIGGP